MVFPPSPSKEASTHEQVDLHTTQDLRYGSPCPGMLQMLRVVALFFPWEKLSSPSSALCLNFFSFLLSFSLPRAGTALPAPRQQNIRGMEGAAGHLHGVRPHPETFPEIYGHENPLIQQGHSKSFGAGWCFQTKYKKEKPFVDHQVG